MQARMDTAKSAWRNSWEATYCDQEAEKRGWARALWTGTGLLLSCLLPGPAEGLLCPCPSPNAVLV